MPKSGVSVLVEDGHHDHTVVEDPVAHGVREAAGGEILPAVTIVTDNGGPFRSFRFEAFIAAHPELVHVRTRVRTPGQNGSRERGFGTLKYEWLYLDDIADAVELAERVDAYRHDYNTTRSHQALAWNRPEEVHLGLASPTTPTFLPHEILPTT
ncbi:MAG: integrase core domain-containing protein [Acidimicrobiales bacterium]|nr:integrase core domain-containing protein [Acidimicrobiales bacterium]